VVLDGERSAAGERREQAYLGRAVAPLAAAPPGRQHEHAHQAAARHQGEQRAPVAPARVVEQPAVGDEVACPAVVQPAGGVGPVRRVRLEGLELAVPEQEADGRNFERERKLLGQQARQSREVGYLEDLLDQALQRTRAR
jgi:hypothetical protein